MSDREVGTVKCFNDAEGYGSIARENADVDRRAPKVAPANRRKRRDTSRGLRDNRRW